MLCPRCHKEVPDGPECPFCGVVMAKFRPRPAQGPRPASPAPKIPPPAQDTPPGARPAASWGRGIGAARRAAFFGQWSFLLEAGLPIVESLRHFERRPDALSRALGRVRAELERGAQLGAAAATAPEVFAREERILVEVGERTGSLPAVARTIAQVLEWRLALRRQMIRACLYPAILFYLSFFLLPLSRLVTGGLGSYLSASLVPAVLSTLGIVCVGWGVPWLFRRLLGEENFSALVRRLPILGAMRRARSQLLFTRHLAMANEAGLEVFASLELAARATGDAWIESRTERAARRVREGATLGQALSEAEFLDEAGMAAVTSGEAAGKLSEVLEQQARLQEGAYLHRVQVAVQLFAVGVLLLVYLYVAWSVFAEYRGILSGTGEQMEKLLREAGGGTVPPELREILR
ncbi:MAG: hypothetical protein GYA21_14450 [Myxococcales bacterium]|nr:hypothetical protein [Myxococcales bacterium]